MHPTPARASFPTRNAAPPARGWRCAVAFAATLAAAVPVAAAPAYDIVDLGTLGGDLTIAYGVDKFGDVTGYSYLGPQSQGGPYQAFTYTNGQMTALAFGDRTYTAAYAINSFGAIAGIGDFLPWFYDGQRHDIDVSTLGDVYGFALAVNDVGQVAGESQAPGGSEQNGYDTQAFFWSGPNTNTLQGLGKLGGRRAGARGIDPKGSVVGYTQLDTGGPYSFPWSPGHAFLWKPGGGMRDLNKLTQCGSTTSLLELLSANAINARGHIAGLAGPKLDATQRRAFLATPAACADAGGKTRYLTTDLGTFVNGGFSYALAVNGLDLVTGAAYRDASGSGNFEAALFGAGQVQNLNDLIPNSIYTGSGGDLWRLREATGVNDNGQIVGWGERFGQRRAFLMTPLARISVHTSADVPAGTQPLLEVDGSHFAGAAKVSLKIYRGVAGGPIAKQTTVSANADGALSWVTHVACGKHYVVAAQDVATGVGSSLGEIDVACRP